MIFCADLFLIKIIPNFAYICILCRQTMKITMAITLKLTKMVKEYADYEELKFPLRNCIIQE